MYVRMYVCMYGWMDGWIEDGWIYIIYVHTRPIVLLFKNESEKY